MLSSRDKSKWPDFIARKVEEVYLQLPKKGKPSSEEWTVVAAILLECPSEETIEVNTFKLIDKVVALGTGTKCIPAKLLVSDGSVLNDSHAEVLARRAFLLYLLTPDNFHVVRNEEGQLALQPGIRIHFYTSHAPCGDASITRSVLEGQEMELHEGEEGSQKEQDNVNLAEPHHPTAAEEQNTTTPTQLNYEPNDPTKPIAKEEQSAKRRKLDFKGTGARRLPAGNVAEQEAKAEVWGTYEDEIGKVRRKPGRGFPTASMSCSDKLALWLALGLQGTLGRHLFAGSLLPSTLTVGYGFSEPDLARALFGRVGQPVNTELYQARHHFVGQTNKVDLYFKVSSNASINWVRGLGAEVTIGTNGKKFGTVRKNHNSPKQVSRLAKRNIFRAFLERAADLPGRNYSTYRQWKEASPGAEVRTQWAAMWLAGWTRNDPSLLQFTV